MREISEGYLKQQLLLYVIGNPSYETKSNPQELHCGG